MPPATEKATNTSQPVALPPPSSASSPADLAIASIAWSSGSRTGARLCLSVAKSAALPTVGSWPAPLCSGVTFGSSVRGGSQSETSSRRLARSILVTSGELSKLGSRLWVAREVRAYAARSDGSTLNCGSRCRSDSL